MSVNGSPGIAERAAELRARIAAAARRAGRDPAAVTLIGASKTVAPDRIRAALAAGVTTFGENRVQEAAAKMPLAPGACWHFIGRLQRNKARRAVELFDLIHTLDSLKLGEALDRLGQERGRPVDALIEVNLAGEETKGGFPVSDLPRALTALAGRPGLCICGLMAVPPPAADPSQARPHFRRLAQLARQLQALGLEHVDLRRLSMGMSDDFEVAVEEGATFVRIGTALFGPRRLGLDGGPDAD